MEQLIRVLSKEINHRTKSEIDYIVEFTKDVLFFKNYRLKENGIFIHRACCKSMQIAIYKENQTVFHIGKYSIQIDSVGDKFYVILQGTVVVQIRIENQHELFNIRELHEGDAFGELALLNKKPRMATILCRTQCVFGVLLKQDFKAILYEDQRQAQQKNIDFLSRIPIFKVCTSQQLRMLHNNSFQINLDKDRLVCSSGQVPNQIFVIKEGIVSVKKQVLDRLLTILELGPEQVIGLHEFMNSQPLEYDVITNTNAVLLKIGNSQMLQKYIGKIIPKTNQFKQLIQSQIDNMSRIHSQYSIFINPKLKTEDSGTSIHIDSQQLVKQKSQRHLQTTNVKIRDVMSRLALTKSRREKLQIMKEIPLLAELLTSTKRIQFAPNTSVQKIDYLGQFNYQKSPRQRLLKQYTDDDRYCRSMTIRSSTPLTQLSQSTCSQFNRIPLQKNKTLYKFNLENFHLAVRDSQSREGSNRLIESKSLSPSEIYQMDQIVLLLGKEPKHRSKQEVTHLQQLLDSMPFFIEQALLENGPFVVRECCRLMHLEQMKGQQVVFQVDSFGDKFYVILEGQVEVFCKERVRVLSAGDSFGELALINHQPRSATIKCLTDCSFAVLNAEEFKQILQLSQEEIFQKNLAFFQQVPIFAHLNYNQLKGLFVGSFLYTFVKNQIVIKEGDNADSLFVVRDGEFALVKTCDNKQFDLLRQGEKSVLGLTELMRTSTFDYSIKCTSNLGHCYKIAGNHMLFSLLKPTQGIIARTTLLEKKIIDKQIANASRTISSYQQYLTHTRPSRQLQRQPNQINQIQFLQKRVKETRERKLKELIEKLEQSNDKSKLESSRKQTLHTEISYPLKMEPSRRKIDFKNIFLSTLCSRKYSNERFPSSLRPSRQPSGQWKFDGLLSERKRKQSVKLDFLILNKQC